MSRVNWTIDDEALIAHVHSWGFGQIYKEVDGSFLAEIIEYKPLGKEIIMDKFDSCLIELMHWVETELMSRHA